MVYISRRASLVAECDIRKQLELGTIRFNTSLVTQAERMPTRVDTLQLHAA